MANNTSVAIVVPLKQSSSYDENADGSQNMPDIETIDIM